MIYANYRQLNDDTAPERISETSDEHTDRF